MSTSRENTPSVPVELAEKVLVALEPASEGGNLWAVAWVVRIKMAQMFPGQDDEHLAEELEAFKVSMGSLIESLAPVFALIAEIMGQLDD